MSLTRFKALALSCVTMLAFVGCGGESGSESDSTTTTPVVLTVASPSIVSIDESTPKAITIIVNENGIKITDFWLSLSGADADYFYVADSYGSYGEIYFKNLPNFEDKTTYYFTVEITGVGVSTTQDITINILDVDLDLPIQVVKTGQTTLYRDGDDAFYSKGLAKDYLRIDNIVTDYANNLQWQDNLDVAVYSKGWRDAESYCSDLTLGIKTDWRLPTIQELLSISNFEPTVMGTVMPAFQNVSSKAYWSSTTAREGTRAVMGVDFNNLTLHTFNRFAYTSGITGGIVEDMLGVVCVRTNN